MEDSTRSLKIGSADGKYANMVDMAGNQIPNRDGSFCSLCLTD
jgi:hypothetical protein